MRIKVLASGSKGNSTYVCCGDMCFLIDIGINYKTLCNALESEGITPKDLYGVLITHIHTDHIKGLASLVKKTNMRVFVPELIANDLRKVVPSDNLMIISDTFHLADVCVQLIHTSHDVPCSVGYVISYGSSSLVYITDTGYVNRKYFDLLKNRTIYILESNHDEKMVMDGPYPYILKQRVLSDDGHLSNRTASTYLQNWIGPDTRYIVLAHLSEINNTPEVAMDTLNDTFQVFPNELLDVKIAKQHEPLETIEV